MDGYLIFDWSVITFVVLAYGAHFAERSDLPGWVRKRWGRRRPSNWKEAKAAGKADPLAGWASERRAVRAKSHNEWLFVWYNALPIMEKSRLNNAWENKSMDLYHAMLRMSGDLREYRQEQHRYLLHGVSDMVDTLVHENTMEDVSGTAGHRGSRDVLVGDRGGAVALGRARFYTGAGPESEVFKIREACTTCACGPHDGC